MYSAEILFIIIYKGDIFLDMESSEQKEQNRISSGKKRRKHGKKTGFYYSFLTIALIFCLIQIGYGAILNISKIISYQGKTITLQNLLKEAQAKNQDLRFEKRMVTSDNSLEGIARNNLKMAGEDEVLIIINKKPEEPKKKKESWHIKNMFVKKEKKQEQNTGNIYIPQEVIEE